MKIEKTDSQIVATWQTASSGSAFAIFFFSMLGSFLFIYLGAEVSQPALFGSIAGGIFVWGVFYSVSWLSGGTTELILDKKGVQRTYKSSWNHSKKRRINLDEIRHFKTYAGLNQYGQETGYYGLRVTCQAKDIVFTLPTQHFSLYKKRHTAQYFSLSDQLNVLLGELSPKTVRAPGTEETAKVHHSWWKVLVSVVSRLELRPMIHWLLRFSLTMLLLWLLFLCVNYLMIIKQRAFEQEQILEFYARHISTDVVDGKGRTLLHDAVCNANIKVVKFLSQGADVNAKDNDGRSPIHEAVYNANIKVVEFLVFQGADVNAKDNDGQMSLHSIAKNPPNIKGAKFLVSKARRESEQQARAEAKAKREAKSRKSGNPFAGSIDSAVNLSIAFMPDIKDYEGEVWTQVLWNAALDHNIEVAKFLMSQGADVNAKDKYGHTPLDVAIDGEHIEVANFLRTRGASPAKNNSH